MRGVRTFRDAIFFGAVSIRFVAADTRAKLCDPLDAQPEERRHPVHHCRRIDDELDKRERVHKLAG